MFDLLGDYERIINRGIHSYKREFVKDNLHLYHSIEETQEYFIFNDALEKIENFRHKLDKGCKTSYDPYEPYRPRLKTRFGRAISMKGIK